MKKILHAVYLKQDIQFRSLSKIALAQLILKIIFVNIKISSDNLVNELNALINGNFKNDDLEIKELLRNLVNQKKIVPVNEKYTLKDSYCRLVEETIKAHEERFDNVINYWFNKTECDYKIIKDWFENVTIKFFEEYSYEWIDQICRSGVNKKQAPNIMSILETSFDSIKEISIEDKEWLKKKYLNFLESERQVDNTLLWEFGTAMFSSTLITARRFQDNISLELFANSKFILDTNVLMSLGLEGHDLAYSFEALEKVLIKLKIKPCFFYISRNEFIRAITNKKSEILKTFQNYSKDILKKIKDPFVKTALKRGCETEEDLDIYFGEIEKLPECFHERLKIDLVDDKELITEIEKGEKDVSLQNQINAIKLARTKREKRENARKHDAGLIYGAKALRKEQKCWILTLDGTVKQYAIENTIRDEYPIAISLDVLLNIMAVNSAGTDIDPTDFAPLFATIIKLTLFPDEQTFTIEDLSYMLDTKIQIDELDDESINEIATGLNKLRIEGKTDEEIGLFLRRSFQKEKLKMKSDLETKREELFIEKEKSEKLESENKIIIENYRKKRKPELQDQYESKIRSNRIKYFIVLPITIILITYFILINIEKTNNSLVLACSIGIEILSSLLLSKFWINTRLIKKHIEFEHSIDLIIENEIREMKQTT